MTRTQRWQAFGAVVLMVVMSACRRDISNLSLNKNNCKWVPAQDTQVVAKKDLDCTIGATRFKLDTAGIGEQ